VDREATCTLPTDRDRLLALLRALLPEPQRRYHVTSMAVFGSRVRDDFTPSSDLDLLITFDDTANLFDLVGLETDFSERLGVKVDTVTPASLKTRLRDAILSSAVPV
jgi:hypothetical protein